MPSCVSVCVRDNAKSCQRISMQFLRGVGRMISSRRSSGFDVDPDHETDPGIFLRNVYHCGVGASVRILRVSAGMAEVCGFRV